MLSLQSTFEKLISSLLDRLQETEYKETDLFARLETCIRICEEGLQQLRQWVIDNSFPDQATEIHFFKHVKPLIMSRYMYYHRLYRLHIGYFNGIAVLEKERLLGALQEVDRFFADNKVFYEYYRKKDTHYDALYFVRSMYDWKFCPDVNHFDPVFATSGDIKMAELMAHELLLEYISQQLNPSCSTDNNTSLPVTASGLHCTESIANIVVLGYALYLIGFFNHGKAALKEVMNYLSVVLKVDLQKYSHTFLRVRGRKADPLKYFDELKACLHQYINKLEE
jgi:hypothetical protein